MREDEQLTGEILTVIKALKAVEIARQGADGVQVLPFFHDAHLRAQTHRGHAQLCKLFGREVDSQDHGHHARTSCLSSRRKPAHIRSPASDQK